VFKKHLPDMAVNLTDEQILELRTNPEIAQEMVLRLTEDNAEGLGAAGLDASETNLYLSHFLGIDGAKRVLTAADGTPIEDVIGPDAVAANPFLKGMTTGQVISWAAGKMGDTEPASLGDYTTDPWMSTLTPGQVFAFTKDADSALLKQHTDAITEWKSTYQARYTGALAAIMDKGAGMGAIEGWRREGWLSDPQDIAKLTNLVLDRDKDTIVRATALAQDADPNFQYNPFVKEHRDAANVVYQQMGGASGLTGGSTVAIDRLRGFVEKRNIIPEDAINTLRAGMTSADPNVRATSYMVMGGLDRAFPDAVYRSFSDAEIKKLAVYEDLAPMVPPEDLAVRLDPRTDPQRRKVFEEMHAEGVKLAQDLDISTVLNAFEGNSGVWDFATAGMANSEPLAPLEAKAATELMRDYRSLAAEYYALTGDFDKASERAVKQLQLKWGVTDSGPDLRIVAYPPERFYPAVDGGHDWLGENLEQTVKARFPDAQDWAIVTVPETEATARPRGQPYPDYPVYQVMVIDGAGIPRIMSDKAGRPEFFRFDHRRYSNTDWQEFGVEDQAAGGQMSSAAPVVDDVLVGIGAPEQ